MKTGLTLSVCGCIVGLACILLSLEMALADSIKYDSPDSDLVKRVPFTALRDKDIGTLQRIVDNESGVVCYRSYASYSYALSCVKL